MSLIMIKILVATHKKTSHPKSDILLPIQVGANNTNLKLSIQQDNDGESISEKNNQYSELTAIYWAWKNLKDVDFIGLAHYRRYPTFRKVPYALKLKNRIIHILYRYIYAPLIPGKNHLYWHKIDKNYNEGDFKDFDESITENLGLSEILIPKPVIMSSTNIKNYFHQRLQESIIQKTQKIISNKYPELTPLFTNTMMGYKLYPCNMFIFKRNIFENYANMMFQLFTDLEVELLKEDIKLPPRSMGYLGELITSTYISFLLSKQTPHNFFNLLKIDDL